LQKFLGAEFTSKTQLSFRTVFQFISGNMEIGYNRKA
jgi:hypothetical protein